MNEPTRFLSEHRELVRRHFLKIGAGGLLASGLWAPRAVLGEAPPAAELAELLAKLEPYFTAADDFQDVSRGDPIPHTLSEEKLRQVGLTRDTWRLEVIADPENTVRLRKPLRCEDDTALDFAGLMQLAEKRAVRFPKVMTCLNIGCPLGMGIWEGVPLRDVVWLTQPREDLRRVVYYGYHNDDAKQMFRSSLPIGRVMEDPFDLPPVILCYKLNGQWLSSKRGGPVRMVVPEAYGFKSIKWLSHVLLSNLPHANDTYAEQGNDIDSPLKSFAASLDVSRQVRPHRPIPITGYAQVGIGGLSKVQVWIHPDGEPLPKDDRYYLTAPWRDVEILPPPAKWGGDLPDDKIPANTMGFATSGQPRNWPLRLSKVHWATVHPGLPAGKYKLRSRTVDLQGYGQPMPRPFRKSGHTAFDVVQILVSEDAAS